MLFEIYRNTLKFIRTFGRKILGIEEWELKFKRQQEQLDALHYFLNHFHDWITSEKLRTFEDRT